MWVFTSPPPCPHPRLSTQRSLSPGQGRSRGAPAAGVAGSGEAQPGVGLGDRPLTLLFPGLPKEASTSQGPGQRSAGPHTSQGPSCRRSRGGKWGRTGRCLPQTQKKAPPLQLLRSGSRGPAPSPRPAPPPHPPTGSLSVRGQAGARVRGAGLPGGGGSQGPLLCSGVLWSWTPLPGRPLPGPCASHSAGPSRVGEGRRAPSTPTGPPSISIQEKMSPESLDWDPPGRQMSPCWPRAGPGEASPTQRGCSRRGAWPCRWPAAGVADRPEGRGLGGQGRWGQAPLLPAAQGSVLPLRPPVSPERLLAELPARTVLLIRSSPSLCRPMIHMHLDALI